MSQDAFLRFLYDTSRNYGLRDTSPFTSNNIATIIINEKGEYVTVEAVKKMTVPRRVFAAQDKQIGLSDDESKPRFLVEKPDVLIGNSPFREVFVDQIAKAVRATKDKHLSAVLSFFKLLNAHLRARIRADMDRALGTKHKYAEASFAIYGRTKNQEVLTNAVKRWWAKEFLRQLQMRFAGCREGFCQISGNRDIIPDSSPLPVSGAGALISANFPSAEFGGYPGLSASHVGLSAGLDISVAFDHIARNMLSVDGKTKQTKFFIPRSNMSVLGWFLNPSLISPHDEGAIKESWDPETDLEPAPGEQSHLDWIRKEYGSPRKGAARALKPADTGQYCAMLIEQNKSRAVLQEICFLTLSRLRASIVQWEEDVVWYDNKISPRRAIWLLTGESKTTPAHVVRSVHRAFFRGQGLSHVLFSQLVNMYRDKTLSGEAGLIRGAVSLLKMMLIREGVSMSNEWSLERAQQSMPFALGSLLSLVALAEDPRSRGRKSHIVPRFLSAYLTNPARTLSGLCRSFHFYVRRMTDRPALASRIMQAYDCLMAYANQCPTVLSPKQKAELVVGVSMMREALASKKPLAELFNKENKNGQED
jgi:hypothetical protein